MASKDFNTFMDSYINNIRDKKDKPFSVQKQKETDYEENVPSNIGSDSIYIIKKPKTFIEKIKETFTITSSEKFTENVKTENSKTIREEQEFEEEYNELETEERKSGFIEWLRSLFASNVNETYEEIDEISQEEVEKVMQENKISNISTDQNEENIMKKEVSNKSFFQKILNFFGIYVEESDENYDEIKSDEVSEIKTSVSSQEIIDMKDDLKSIAVIATAAFKKLPKEKFKLFKESSDFAKFKTILKKHGVIREKSNTSE